MLYLLMEKPLNDIYKNLKRLNSLLPKTMPVDRIQAKRQMSKTRQMLKKGTARQDIKKHSIPSKKHINTSIHHKNPTPGSSANYGRNAFPTHIDKKTDIIQAIKDNPVIIVSGETGSGKTTQSLNSV